MFLPSHSGRGKALPFGVLFALSLLMFSQSSAAQSVVWRHQFQAGLGEQSANAIATHSSGIYVAGITYGALPGQTSTGTIDPYVRKYDLSGNVLWTRQFGGIRANAVVTDDSGVYVAGEMLPPVATVQNNTDIFVRKFDHSGNELWAGQFAGPHWESATGLSIDSTGLYAAGRITEVPASGPFLRDVYVLKFDVNGNVLWSRRFGSTADDGAWAVSSDSSGVYVAGETAGTLPGQVSSGLSDVFLRKYDVDGNEIWTRQFGSAGNDLGRAVFADASGVYVTGWAASSLPGQTSFGGDDIFVGRYDHSGNEMWTRQFGTAASDSGRAIAADSSSVYVGGGLGLLPGQSGSTGLLKRLDLFGNEVWSRQFTLGLVFGVSLYESRTYLAGSICCLTPGQIDNDAVVMAVTKDFSANINVIAPNGGESIASGFPFQIQWTASSSSPLSFFDVFYSVDAGATFNPVPGCSNVSGAASSCTWPSPGPATTLGLVRVVASDGANTASDDSDAVFSIISPPPTIASISPSVMNPGQTVSVTISGTDFVTGNTVINFTVGTGVTATNVQVLSATQLTATFMLAGNTPVGGHWFTLTTPSGTSPAHLFDVLNRPVLNSITPNSGIPGTAVNVTLNGAFFYNNSMINIAGGDITLSNVVRVSNSQMTARFNIASNATLGPRNVTISNLAGTSNAVTFNVTSTPPAAPPTTTSISPAVMHPGGAFAVTITGTNFVNGNTTINFTQGTGVTASNIQVQSSTQLTAFFLMAANASLGGHRFTVSTPAGASMPRLFDVLRPSTLTSITPNAGSVENVINVTLVGTFFYNGSTILTSRPGITVSNVVKVNNNQMTATFTIAPNAVAGPVNVTVSNLAGTTNAVTFTIQ